MPKKGNDDYTQNWREMVATMSAPICSVMFIPTRQCTTYHLCEQFVRDIPPVGLFVGDTKYLMVHEIAQMAYLV